MSSKVERYKYAARNSARRRGHALMGFVGRAPWLFTSACKYCGMAVDVSVKPAPNETAISGEAVALNCIGKP
jgi:hypothetical protein